MKISGNNLMIVDTTRAKQRRLKMRWRSAVASKVVENEDSKNADFIGTTKQRDKGSSLCLTIQLGLFFAFAEPLHNSTQNIGLHLASHLLIGVGVRELEVGSHVILDDVKEHVDGTAMRQHNRLHSAVRSDVDGETTLKACKLKQSLIERLPIEWFQRDPMWASAK